MKTKKAKTRRGTAVAVVKKIREEQYTKKEQKEKAEAFWWRSMESLFMKRLYVPDSLCNSDGTAWSLGSSCTTRFSPDQRDPPDRARLLSTVQRPVSTPTRTAGIQTSDSRAFVWTERERERLPASVRAYRRTKSDRSRVYVREHVHGQVGGEGSLTRRKCTEQSGGDTC